MERVSQTEREAAPFTVTVAIPCLDAAESLPACLRSILLQEGAPPFELLVVDNGSVDATAEVAGRFPGVREIREPRRGIPHARNAAILACRTGLIAFVDADCEAPKDWLRRLVRAAESDADAAAVGGAIENAHPRHLVSAALHLAEFGEQAPAAGGAAPRLTHNVAGANVCYRRDRLLRIGLFDGRLFSVSNEETLLHWRILRAGGRVWFDPAIRVRHRTSRSFRRMMATMRTLGAGFCRSRRIDPSMPYAWLTRSRLRIATLLPAAKLLGILWKTVRSGSLDLFGLAALPLCAVGTLAYTWGALAEAAWEPGEATGTG